MDNKVKLVIDTLMSAKGSDYVSLFCDVVNYISTGEGFSTMMSKVDDIRRKGGVIK